MVPIVQASARPGVVGHPGYGLGDGSLVYISASAFVPWLAVLHWGGVVDDDCEACLVKLSCRTMLIRGFLLCDHGSGKRLFAKESFFFVVDQCLKGSHFRAFGVINLPESCEAQPFDSRDAWCSQHGVLPSAAMLSASGAPFFVVQCE